MHNLRNGDNTASNHSLTETSGKGMVLEEGIEETLKKIDSTENLAKHKQKENVGINDNEISLQEEEKRSI